MNDSQKKTTSRLFFIVKIALLGGAVVILTLNYQDLLVASTPQCVGTFTYGNASEIECVNFVESLKETIYASLITVGALLLDILEPLLIR